MDGLFPLEVKEYYGLNTKQSRARLPLGFSSSIDNFHDVDLSDPGIVRTRAGNDTINDNISVFGTGSGEFDGDGDFLSVPDNADFDFSDGTWTVELRFRSTSLAAKNTIYFQGTDANNYMEIYVDTDGSLHIVVVAASATVVSVATAAAAVTVNTWFALAFVENGDDWFIFVNGTDAATSGNSDTSRAANYTGVVRIGSNQFITAAETTGNIDELRVSDTARYTATYTIATAAFSSDGDTKLLLHFEGDDNSTTFTDDGDTTHTVTANGNAALKVGTLTFTPRRIHDYFRPSANEHRLLINGGTKLVLMDHQGRWTTIGTGLTTDLIMDFVNFGDRSYMGNGTDEGKATDDGTGMRKWGITKPAAAPTVATGAAGVLTGDYKYAFSFLNSTTGHESTRSALSAQVSPSSEKVELSVMAASADTQVTDKRIYRTTAGGAIFFLLTTITNATTTFSDNVADTALGTAEAAEFNDPPPVNPAFIEEWDGRIFFSTINATRVYFTNDEFRTPADNGLGEESVHPDNFIEFHAKVFGIKKSPNFNENWVHTSKGIFAILATGIADDPYAAVIRNSNWHAISHYTIDNVYNDQWFLAQEAKIMSVDSAGGIDYESYFIEPTLEAGNKVQFDNAQAAHYRGQKKNQYRMIFQSAGQTTPDRMLAGNYLNRTLPDENGFSYPSWEYHRLPATAMAVVIDDSTEAEILYTGDSDGKIRFQDTGTDDDGTAINWSMELGWTRTVLDVSKSLIARYLKTFYKPLGDWPFSVRVDYDFGLAGGRVRTVQVAPVGDQFNIDLIFDTSVFAPENALVPRDLDLDGSYTYVSVVWSGLELNEVFEMNNVVLLFLPIEGFRGHEYERT